MGNIFNLDSPLMSFLNRMADLMGLGILTLICCIPIFTIGASLSAMHYVLLKMARKEEGYIIKPFFKAFKDNFKQATAEWLIFLLIFFVLFMDLYVLRHNPDMLPAAFTVIIFVVLVMAYMVFQWVFPLQMHFTNTVKGTLKNAFLLSIANFPRSLVMMLVWAVPLVALYISTRVIPLVVLFGISLPGLACAYMYNKPFKKFEPEPEPVKPDEDFTLEGMQETARAIHDTAQASANPDIQNGAGETEENQSEKNSDTK